MAVCRPRELQQLGQMLSAWIAYQPSAPLDGRKPVFLPGRGATGKLRRSAGVRLARRPRAVPAGPDRKPVASPETERLGSHSCQAVTALQAAQKYGWFPPFLPDRAGRLRAEEASAAG